MITTIESLEDLRKAYKKYKDQGYIPMTPTAFSEFEDITTPPIHCACENCWNKKIIHSFMGLRIKVVDSL